MISFDLECGNEHRFEGIFRDYESFADQMARGMLSCPLCENGDIRRLFSGCSIQARPSIATTIDRKSPNLFELMRQMESYVKENFDNVGTDFAETARPFITVSRKSATSTGSRPGKRSGSCRRKGSACSRCPLPAQRKTESTPRLHRSSKRKVTSDAPMYTTGTTMLR